MTTALLLVYWFGAAFSASALGLLAWVITRSLFVAWVASFFWICVAVYMFSVYRAVVRLEF
jgi:hypothetical protein